MLDNREIYGLCQKTLNIERPSYDNLNRLIGKVLSSMTESSRFEGEMNANLVSFARLHFMTRSMAPVLTKEKTETEKNDEQSINIGETGFPPESFLVKLNGKMRVLVTLWVIFYLFILCTLLFATD